VRRIVLCADDYGLTKPINTAIRGLIETRRINATSVMVIAPGFDKSEADALAQTAGQHAQIGLHVTLTAPFKDFRPLNDTLRAALLRQLDGKTIRDEIESQIKAFIAAFGRPPDFADGHQHVHLFPQIRDVFLTAVAEFAPNAWVRQCGRAPGAPHKLRDRKALILDVLSVRFRRKAAARGLKSNPAFAGTYDFGPSADFPALFARFLDGLPGWHMTSPPSGKVDAQLRQLDPLTDLRERELEFLHSDDYPALLATKRAALA